MTTSRAKTVLVSLAVFVAILFVETSARAQPQSSAGTTLTTAQLEQLVAPIALYPDDLLSQVLMASTYPLEVVEAARWSRENPKVFGQELEDAMQKQSWDPSVKALTAVPQTLAMMNDQLKWTQDLGDAFLAQQSDVFDAVQRLRARADVSGNLKTTPQQKVTRTSRPAGSPSTAPAQAYVIELASPSEYYVPIYDPGVVYGAWPYPAYSPFYWYPPGYVATGVFGFAAAAVAGAAIWGGVNWWNRNVNVNVNRYNNFNRTNISNSNWSHNAAHRGGVPYANQRVAQQYGGGRDKARESARQNLAKQGGGMGGKGDGGMGKAAWAKAAWAKAAWAKAAWAKAAWAKAAWAKAAWARAAWARAEWKAAGAAWARAEWARAEWAAAAWRRTSPAWAAVAAASPAWVVVAAHAPGWPEAAAAAAVVVVAAAAAGDPTSR